MQLTLRQAAPYFSVDEATLRGWIKKRGLPVHKVNEQLYLNPVELWQWAMENGVVVSRRLLDDARQAAEEIPPLSGLLQAGGIHTDLARGFIRAETMTVADLVRLGGEREIKAAGLVRQEPKDYAIQDGDIINIKHN